MTYGQPKIVPGEFNGDLRGLPLAPKSARAPKPYRPLRRPPPQPKFATAPPAPKAAEISAALLALMPSPIQDFAGLSSSDNCAGGQCGAGWPPDPNGDVGPNHYVEAVNDAVAIYNKTGVLLASFTEDNLWSGVDATPCNGNAQGDPIVIYDWLADRFVITWFAFPTDASGNSVSPYYQCIAASKTSDPVTGGWWLYPIRMDPGTPGTPPVGVGHDYSKFGLWHDCLYMGANEFDAAGNYDGVSFASFSRADLYSGAALTYSLGWLGPASNAFTMVPSNNQGRGAKAAQPGTPNYFVSESQSTFVFEVRTFVAGPNCGAGGTLSASTSVSQQSYTVQQGAIVPEPGFRRKLDMIDDRIMQKVQYRRLGGVESLWVTHPVGSASGTTAMQWAQLDVTGGTIAATPVQQQIYAPDAVLYRFMGSLAVDSQGNMALGYTTSSSTQFPSIAYSGRLATDPPNTLPQGEVQFIAGGASQLNNCGGTKCDRWGDYSAMSVDPADDCTFWYVNEYYANQTNGLSGNWQTRIGSFKFPSCSGLPGTTTKLTSSANPSVFGANVDLTAMVSGATPTGTVNFRDGASSIAGCGAVALSGGGDTPSAVCSTSALGVGTHNIVAAYGGDAGNAPSASPILAQVVNSGSPPASFVNPSFELPSLGSGFQYNPTGAGVGWTFSSGSGIQANGSAWGAAPAPDGKQTAFVQGTSTLSQSLSFTAGTYTLSFQAARRACCLAPNVQPVKVTVDGTQIGSLVSPPGTSFSAVSIPFSVAGGGAHTITLAGTDANDRTTFIDAVALSPGIVATVTLASSLNPARVGRSVTFTAMVEGASPMGNVAFTSNGTAIAGCSAVALTGSGSPRSALCTTTFSATGTFSILASYGGDGTNPPAASAPLAEVIKPRR